MLPWSRENIIIHFFSWSTFPVWTARVQCIPHVHNFKYTRSQRNFQGTFIFRSFRMRSMRSCRWPRYMIHLSIVKYALKNANSYALHPADAHHSDGFLESKFYFSNRDFASLNLLVRFYPSIGRAGVSTPTPHPRLKARPPGLLRWVASPH